MSRRGVVRVATAVVLACCGALALVGGVVLHGPNLVILLIAAGLVACVAYGASDDGGAPRPAVALRAAAATMAVGMVVTGVGVLAGAAVAAAVTAAAAAAAGGLLWWRQLPRRGAGGAAVAAPAPSGPVAGPEPLWKRPDPAPLPVSLLPTSALGGEWVRTTAALAGRLDPAARQEIVRRRVEALDELERRDPSGFARWLTAERGPHSDPAAFVRGHRTMGTDAA